MLCTISGSELENARFLLTNLDDVGSRLPKRIWLPRKVFHAKIDASWPQRGGRQDRLGAEVSDTILAAKDSPIVRVSE